MIKAARYTIFLMLLLPLTAAVPPQKIRSVDVAGIKSMVSKTTNDTLYVVNFWATWCKPCIQELPYFETAAKTFSDRKVKVMLVSLDFQSEAAKVEKFVDMKGLKNDVYLLKGGDQNVWINEVDSSWSGAIPATIYYKNGKKLLFHEGDYSQHELDSVINNYL